MRASRGYGSEAPGQFVPLGGWLTRIGSWTAITLSSDRPRPCFFQKMGSMATGTISEK